MRRWFCFLDKEKMLAHRIEVRLREYNDTRGDVSDHGRGTIRLRFEFMGAAAAGGACVRQLVQFRYRSKMLRRTQRAVELASAQGCRDRAGPARGDEAEFWKSAARTQSGHEKIKVKIAISGADQPKTKQLELVREAMARHPRVLIVEPVDPADVELAQAVAGTRAQGIPVVLLGMPLTSDKSAAAGSSGTSTTAPLVVVAPPPFSSSARELVAAAIRNAKAAELDPNGGAIIVINSIGDRFIPDRVAAFREALKTAGITPVEEIRVRQRSSGGRKARESKLEGSSEVRILLFTVDYTSTSAIRGLLSGGGSFRPASNEPPRTKFRSSSRHAIRRHQLPGYRHAVAVAAAVDFTPVRLLRKAIVTAVSLSQGKVISSPAELPLAVEDRPHHAARLRAAIANAKKLSGCQRRSKGGSACSGATGRFLGNGPAAMRGGLHMPESRHEFGEREQHAARVLDRTSHCGRLSQIGDITSAATIPSHARGAARSVARDPGVLAGLAVVEQLVAEFELCRSLGAAPHTTETLLTPKA